MSEIAKRLGIELTRQLDINAKLGEGLMKELVRVQDEGRPILDNEGNLVGTSHIPDRDWARCYGHYRGVNATMLVEERERTKLRLLADKDRHVVLDDEQYAEELRQLGIEAVRSLPPEELAAEIERRGISIPVERESES